MLTQTIFRYSAPAKHADKPRYVSGSDEHRKHIYHNTLKYAMSKWEHGDTVRLKRGKQLGYVIDIVQDYSSVNWNGFKCQFIEVWTANNETLYLHPSDIIG